MSYNTLTLCNAVEQSGVSGVFTVLARCILSCIKVNTNNTHFLD